MRRGGGLTTNSLIQEDTAEVSYTAFSQEKPGNMSCDPDRSHYLIRHPVGGHPLMEPPGMIHRAFMPVVSVCREPVHDEDPAAARWALMPAVEPDVPTKGAAPIALTPFRSITGSPFFR